MHNGYVQDLVTGRRTVTVKRAQAARAAACIRFGVGNSSQADSGPAFTRVRGVVLGMGRRLKLVVGALAAPESRSVGCLRATLTLHVTVSGPSVVTVHVVLLLVKLIR